ncbi:MAG: ECF transporter S component [Lachnospiraceae bacterium]|nr:ECF transporter S component [Lachnospiraceae bacterium]
MDKRIKNLTLVSLFIALVVIGSRIYVGTHDTFRFHLGNSMCLLAAFVLTPFYGGLAAGLGSMLFDILFYTSGPTVLVTFATKFVMGYVAGIVFNKTKSIVLGGIIGEIAYIILYAIKTYIERRFVMSMAFEAVLPILLTKIGASVFNAVAAVIVSTLIYKILKKTKIV